jgi:hypothetical protein
MEADSVGLIVTSIPFSSQYEYSPSFNDFGHNESNGAFWAQMDFLTPELVRVLQAGRVAAIHVTDRVVPGGLNGLGFRTLHPFHAESIEHYTGHGLAFLGMITVVTDVVRENNQTYRLGYSEQCKDADFAAQQFWGDQPPQGNFWRRPGARFAAEIVSQAVRRVRQIRESRERSS